AGFRKRRAEFIGAPARAETRRRRIEALKAQVFSLDGEIVACEADLEVIAADEAKTELELAALPAETETRRAVADLEHAQRQEEAARIAVDEATKRSVEADREADMAAGDLQLHADRNALPPDADPGKLAECELHVSSYVK